MKVYLINKEDRKKLLETEEYKNIFKVFNELNIHKSFCVGYLNNLMKKYSNYKDWQTGYFDSGKERLVLLDSLDSITRKANMEYDYFMTSGRTPFKAIYNYNSDYGRTKEELGDFAKFIKEKMDSEGLEYSIENIYAVVYMNVIQFPWENKKEV